MALPPNIMTANISGYTVLAYAMASLVAVLPVY